MPCNDGYSSRSYEDMARVHLNARVACDALTKLENFLPNEIKNLSQETQNWWAAHKKEDERRLAREKAQRERDALKQSALEKLTAAEAHALGL